MKQSNNKTFLKLNAGAGDPQPGELVAVHVAGQSHRCPLRGNSSCVSGPCVFYFTLALDNKGQKLEVDREAIFSTSQYA